MTEDEKKMELLDDEMAEVVAGSSTGETCAAVTFSCAVASPGVLDFELAIAAMIL